jgi:hypothetical protein
MLLILTGVADGTIDFLVDHLEVPFFRFNLDDYKSYEFEISPESWRIENPEGLVISSESASRCLWWKVFLYQIHDKYIREEMRCAAENLYAWFLAQKRVVGNPPFLEESLGKVRQATVATRYFKTPRQSVGWGKRFLSQFSADSSWVVKSMSSQLTDSGKAIFTTEILPATLDHEVPWYLQEKIDSEADLTILIVGESYFAFSRSRVNLTSLDWRKEQFSIPNPWTPYTLTTKQIQSIRNFCRDLDLSWGRMDFLLIGDEIIFLEINPNGQWVFLDPTNSVGLISAVANYFSTGNI